MAANEPAPPRKAWQRRGLAVAVALAMLAVAYWAPSARRRFIHNVVNSPGVASPSQAPDFAGSPDGQPPSTGLANLASEAVVRVVLLDGLSPPASQQMPTLQSLCARGADLEVDVGFPTVSLPVQVAFWSGLSQQQTGVLFYSGRRLEPPLTTAAIPAQIPGSIVVAEAYPYIVHSLGFSRVEPADQTGTKVDDKWKASWHAQAIAAMASDARLAFVHVLRIDTAGHKHGGDSPEYTTAVAESDEILRALLDADRNAARSASGDATWVVLSDHGHLATGGHGGEEPSVRFVRACAVGPNIQAGTTGFVHLVDISRLVADTLGVTLPANAAGRPFAVALAHPAPGTLPGIPWGRRGWAWAVFFAGVAATAWGMGRRWTRGPWWWPAALALVVIQLGVPSLSTPFIYKPLGRDMYMAYWPALLLLAIGCGVQLGRRPLLRIAASQLALPVAALAASLIACGGLGVFTGIAAPVAPVVPRWTAWASPIAIMVAHAAAVFALAALATLVPRWFDRGAPAGTANKPP